MPGNSHDHKVDENSPECFRDLASSSNTTSETNIIPCELETELYQINFSTH